MEFLAYGDIHHDNYTNGVVEQDVIDVEDQITQYAVDNGINKVFFLGDWYRATNPTRDVIASAEFTWKKRSDCEIETIVLVGNHDRWTKSAISGHAFISANMFQNDLKHVKVIDEASEINIDGVNFFCIPAGHENTEEVINYNSNSNIPLVVLFHGLISGSALANGGSVSGGINPGTLRKLKADLFLGGDNHTHQRLDDILGAPSMYLGAPLCHNWGDRGQKRGFWHISLSQRDIPLFKFVSSKSPRFVRLNVQARSDAETLLDIVDRVGQELEGNPGIVDIRLIGRNAATISQDLIKNTLESTYSIRNLKIIVDQAFERLEVAPGVTVAETPEDKWSAYISHGEAPGIDKFNPSMLVEMGKWAIQEAKKIL